MDINLVLEKIRNRKKSISIDSNVHAIYIQIDDEPIDKTIELSKDMDCIINIDVSKDGNPVGIEYIVKDENNFKLLKEFFTLK